MGCRIIRSESDVSAPAREPHVVYTQLVDITAVDGQLTSFNVKNAYILMMP